jgi:hypothetical protein
MAPGEMPNPVDPSSTKRDHGLMTLGEGDWENMLREKEESRALALKQRRKRGVGRLRVC